MRTFILVLDPAELPCGSSSGTVRLLQEPWSSCYYYWLLLVFPSELVDMVPEQKSCTADLFGAQDPLRILSSAGAMYGIVAKKCRYTGRDRSEQKQGICNLLILVRLRIHRLVQKIHHLNLGGQTIGVDASAITVRCRYPNGNP